MITHNVGCPICWVAGIESPLVSPEQGGEYRCSRNAEHKGFDSSDLQRAPVLNRPIPKPPVRPQPNHTQLILSIPIVLKQMLEAKFGDKLSATTQNIFAAMLDDGAFIVSSDTQKRIFDNTGQDVRSPDKFVGATYSLRQDRMLLQSEVDNLKKTSDAGGLSMCLSVEDI